MRKGRASSVSTLKANLLLAFIFLPLPLLWITGLPLNISNRTEKRKADRSAPAELLCRVFDPAVAVIAASRQREPGFISAPALFCQQQRLLVAPGAEQHGQLPAAVTKGAAVIFPYPGTTWEQQWKPLSTLAGKGPEENRTWRKRSHPSFQRRGYTGLVTAPPLSVSSYSAHRNSRAKCLEQTWRTAFQISLSNPSKSVFQETEKGFQNIPTPFREWMTFKQLEAGWIYILLQKKAKYIHEEKMGGTTVISETRLLPFLPKLTSCVWISRALACPSTLAYHRNRTVDWGNIFKVEAQMERVRYHTQGKFIVHSFVFKWCNATAGRRSSS